MAVPFNVPHDAIVRLGNGSPEVGEAVLGRMFQMAGPRAIHPNAARELGNGNAATGRKVLQRFVANLRGDKYSYEHIPPRYAKGGKVKMSKAAANYRDGFEDDKFCARCSMFRVPASCTLVEGKISRTSLCDRYEKAR